MHEVPAVADLAAITQLSSLAVEPPARRAEDGDHRRPRADGIHGPKREIAERVWVGESGGEYADPRPDEEECRRRAGRHEGSGPLHVHCGTEPGLAGQGEAIDVGDEQHRMIRPIAREHVSLGKKPPEQVSLEDERQREPEEAGRSREHPRDPLQLCPSLIALPVPEERQREHRVEEEVRKKPEMVPGEVAAVEEVGIERP